MGAVSVNEISHVATSRVRSAATRSGRPDAGGAQVGSQQPKVRVKGQEPALRSLPLLRGVTRSELC